MKGWTVNRRALLVCVCVVALVSSGITQQSAPAPAGAEIDAIVRQILEERLAAGDIPDIGLLGNAKRIAIRSDLPKSRLLLGPRAVPERQGYEFRLISTAEATAEADRTKTSVHFISVDRLEKSADTVSLWLGTDFVLPSDSKNVKTCCCESLVKYQRTNGSWAFAGWGAGVCR
jgi:hypothetical protein